MKSILLIILLLISFTLARLTLKELQNTLSNFFTSKTISSNSTKASKTRLKKRQDTNYIKPHIVYKRSPDSDFLDIGATENKWKITELGVHFINIGCIVSGIS